LAIPFPERLLLFFEDRADDAKRAQGSGRGVGKTDEGWEWGDEAAGKISMVSMNRRRFRQAEHPGASLLRELHRLYFST
jgi:hypothetical protein